MLSCFFPCLSVLGLWFPWYLHKPRNSLLSGGGGRACDGLCQGVEAGRGACSADYTVGAAHRVSYRVCEDSGWDVSTIWDACSLSSSRMTEAAPVVCGFETHPVSCPI